MNLLQLDYVVRRGAESMRSASGSENPKAESNVIFTKYVIISSYNKYHWNKVKVYGVRKMAISRL